MSKPNYTYNALVDRVLDGDTIEVVIELWKDLTFRSRLRLNGINTPEIHSKDDKERRAGKKSMAALANVLGFVEGEEKPESPPRVVVKVIGQEKYGRWLAEVYTPQLTKSFDEFCNSFDGHAASGGIKTPPKSVNEWMVENGFAKPYDGGKRWVSAPPENPFLTIADDEPAVPWHPQEPLTEDPK